MTVVVSGFRETARAFSNVNRQFSRDIGKRLRQAAEPVRSGAEGLAGTRIRHMGVGAPWSEMRTGGGIRVVWVAPKQRGRASRKNPRKRRSNLGDLLMERAMVPALEHNKEHVVKSVDGLLENMEDTWGRHG